jgi:hypothetical protein
MYQLPIPYVSLLSTPVIFRTVPQQAIITAATLSSHVGAQRKPSLLLQTVGGILVREPFKFPVLDPPGSLFFIGNMSPRIRSCAICGWIIYDQEGPISWMNQFRGYKSVSSYLIPQKQGITGSSVLMPRRYRINRSRSLHRSGPRSLYRPSPDPRVR